MKYILIPFIALGLVLSLIINIEYDCTGQEMIPTYFGSPFIFAEKSLGSSLEYFYSISGLILNTAIWSLILIIFRLAILKLLKFYNNRKIIKIFYKIIIGFLIVFSGLSIAWSSFTMGEGFNYWYMDLDKEAATWSVKCEGKWKFWHWDF